jgi:2-dehydro-3-deoxyphosphogluconate aldolase/(4S)-4-hydroxy-2-oxoglutarate aldolase
MPGLPKEEVVAEIMRRRASAVMRTDDQGLARDAMSAAVAGGFRIIEFTLTTPGAIELIREFAAKPDLLVGAGTVLTSKQARQAVEAGARFLVAPICDPEIIQEADRLGVASIPGTLSPTEMYTAHRAGADFIKLFPAPPNVAEYVSAILGPLPFLRIVPTAGITMDNFMDALRAGAAAVGFVKPLFDPQDMAERDFSAIEKRAAEITRQIASL